MPGKITSTPFPRAAIAGYAALMLVSAAICVERLAHATVSMAGDPAATATANNMASPQLIDRLSLAADIFALRCQMTLAHLYFDWLAPLSKSFASLGAVPEQMASAVLSLNPLGATAPMIMLGKSQYLLFY